MNTTEKVRNVILGRYPLVYLLGWEETRALQLLEAFSSKMFPDAKSGLRSWSVVTGFSPKDGLPEVREPLQAIETIMNSDSKGIFVLKDFSAFIN
ncbi:MAG TPA: hypothetical protein VFG11_03025, partial [Acidobacteriota bacterium]|nr:hypothetical protein [Acidobacteriota bacterium]